jgi:valyl-tRNA synthetase
MRRPFPDQTDAERDENAEDEMRWLMGFVLGIRRIRGEMDIAPSKPLPVLLAGASPGDRSRLERHLAYLDALARLESITVLNDAETAPQAATALLGDMKILVPMAGLIDVEAEIERLSRQMTGLEKTLAQSEKKLANTSFVTRAPEAVVNKERNRLKETEQALGQLTEQMDKIKELLKRS